MGSPGPRLRASRSTGRIRATWSWPAQKRAPSCAQVRVGVITSWTGADAIALQRSLRMSNQAFAGHLGMAVRTVAYWHQRPGKPLALASQAILDDALERAPDRVKAQFAQLAGQSGRDPAGSAEHVDIPGTGLPSEPVGCDPEFGDTMPRTMISRAR